MNSHANIGLIEQVSAALTEELGDDFDAETFFDTLDGETDFMDIVGQLVQRRVEATNFEAANKTIAKTYTDRAVAMSARSKAITKALGRLLDATGQQKVTHPLATVSRTKPRVTASITDESQIPTQLTVTTTRPDFGAIKKQLDAGEIVPGAELVAGEPGLTVRMK